MPDILTYRDALVQDETGTTTPEYGILLVIAVTTALSIGMLLRETVRDSLEVPTLASQHAPQHRTIRSITQRNPSEFDSPSKGQLNFRDYLIVLQATLATALIVLVLRRNRGERKVAKPIRTRDCLDEQLKNILLALRHQAMNEDTLEPVIGQIMSSDVVTVPMHMRMEQAATHLATSMHEVVFVVGHNESLAGQITDVNLAAGKNVRQVMSDIPLKLDKTMRVNVALRKMLDSGCTVAPVMDHNGLCGVVSTIDIMLALMAMIQLFKETQLRHREMMREACGSTATWDSLSSP